MAERGLFVVLEGIDNCGKTTQSRYLKDYLESQGLPVIQTREPGGTEVGEEIRGVLLKNRARMMDPVSQTLLFYAARKEFIVNVVQPNLGKGVHLLTDRFEASTYVYQGYTQGVDLRLIDSLHDDVVVAACCKPDLYVILDITAEESFRRIENQNNLGQDHVFENQGLGFMRKLREGYLAFAEKHLEEVVLLNGMLSEQDLKIQIGLYIDLLLGERTDVTGKI